MNYELISIVGMIFMFIALSYFFYDTIKSIRGGSFTK